MDVLLCQYCGRPAKCVRSEEIYGRDFGWLWMCRPCNAYVGCHGKTKQPKGSLANAKLRALRRRAHAAFDGLWKRGGMSRSQAYEWLSLALQIEKSDCHIGMFDERQCELVCLALKERAREEHARRQRETVREEVSGG